MQERSFTEPDYDKLRTGLSQKYVPMSKNWTYCIPKVLKNGLSTSRVPKTQYSFWNRLFAGQIAACSCSHASDIFHGMKYMAFSENFRYAKKREPLIPTIAMFHGDHEEKNDGFGAILFEDPGKIRAIAALGIPTLPGFHFSVPSAWPGAPGPVIPGGPN